jgi:RNA polymerase-binding transcription factor DksA
MLESLSERELYELRDISDAIDRIRSGEFGICIECSAEIAEGRLAAYPSVSTCTACAREHEQEDRRRKMLSTI